MKWKGFVAVVAVTIVSILALTWRANAGIDRLSPILPEFERYAENARRDWKIPGMAVTIVSDDKVIYSKGFGVKETGKNDPVRPGTIFQIGSTTKAFTSALMAMRVDEKKFGWRDKVKTHLPDFRMYEPWVTEAFQIRDLMAQHSGLTPYAGDLQSFLGFDRSHIIKSLRYLPPVSSFRTEFAYQNNLFLVAASLIEKYTGKSWEDNVKEGIFQPLGMADSSTEGPEWRFIPDGATPHTRDGDRIIPLGEDWPFRDWLYVYNPAGGINSNVIDMAKWLRFHIHEGKFAGKQLISPENIAFVHSPSTIIKAGDMAGQKGNIRPLLGKGVYYSQGWVYAYDKEPIVWHNGGTSGCKSVVAFLPESKIGIVVLSNLADTQVPELLAQWLFDRYWQKDNTDWNKLLLEQENNIPTPAVNSKNITVNTSLYTGNYTNPIYGDAEIKQEKGVLKIKMGPKKIEGQLKAIGSDKFIIKIPRLYGQDLNITFNKVGDKIGTMTLEDFNADGSGVFQKI